jgi:hypothetical protein
LLEPIKQAQMSALHDEIEGVERGIGFACENDA